MKKRLFTTAKRTFLPPRLMWLGMLLACFAWVMRLSPLLAPLWLDNITAGHGLCIKLAPLVESHHQQHSQHDITAQQSSHLHHENHGHQHPIGKTIQADFQTDTPHDLDSNKQIFHDCDICLALFAFDIPTFDFKLMLYLVLAYCLLIQAIYRSLSQRFVAFLRPPSRASPAFCPCFSL